MVSKKGEFLKKTTVDVYGTEKEVERVREEINKALKKIERKTKAKMYWYSQQWG